MGELVLFGFVLDELLGLCKKEWVLFKDVYECIINNKYFLVYISINLKYIVGVLILKFFIGF